MDTIEVFKGLHFLWFRNCYDAYITRDVHVTFILTLQPGHAGNVYTVTAVWSAAPNSLFSQLASLIMAGKNLGLKNILGF